ncbi:MAG: hypothetical protein EOM62_07705 [Bacteroidia bacterium]|nr:hypothetical protein [Bacteroidia bacterium]
MKKRIISFVMVFVLIAACLPISTFADDVSSEERVSNMIPASINDDVRTRIESEVDIFKSYYIDVNLIASISIDEMNTPTYTLNFGETFDLIKMEQTSSGDLIIDITENDKHDTLKITETGKMYINDYEVTSETKARNTSNNKSDLVHASAWYEQYQSECPYGYPYNYTVSYDSWSENNIVLERDILEVEIGLLAFIIGASCGPLGGLASTLATILFGIAQNHDVHTQYLSCSTYSFTPDGTVTLPVLTYCYKFSEMWFLGPDCDFDDYSHTETYYGIKYFS